MISRTALSAAALAFGIPTVPPPTSAMAQVGSQRQDVALKAPANLETELPPGYTIPTIDLSGETDRQVVVDREPGQYLGHPTTVLLEDGRTILAVYPKGHGRGGIVYKRSDDGGLTWSERLPTPDSWATSLEVPTIHRVVDAEGARRLVVFSGLYPVRMAVSEDDGQSWSELEPVGDFGGVVTMSSVLELATPGHYLAFFHDDGRFIRGGDEERYRIPSPQVPEHASPAAKPWRFWVYTTLSTDGGLSWSVPAPIAMLPHARLCEPGVVRSPDGGQIAVLLRENSRRYNSFAIFSDDEGLTWSEPVELPAALTGDRHVARYAPDGRLFITFRDTTHVSPTKGDWVGWVGRYEDIVEGNEGEYRVRIMDNTKGQDCAYPGLELLPDGTFVTTTYGHWTEGEEPYVVSVRFRIEELDAKVAALATVGPSESSATAEAPPTATPESSAAESETETEAPPAPAFEPMTPEESLAALRLPEGFRAEIVAAEPQVFDPVAFDWDAEGRLWVVEMYDYPLGLGDEGASGGRIRVLEDRDGDGVYESSTLFADGLNFPTGIVAWREGVIVTAAPDILYLEDSTGDGQADVQEVLYTGLTEGNQQLRANGLRWGLDNWLYVAAGGHHGRHGADTVLRSMRAGIEVAVGSRDFRIRPDSGEVEPQSGPAQFGRDRDDWGRWFGTQNSHPLWHYALPDHYLRRNPYFAAPDGRVQLPGGSNPPVYAVSQPEQRFHSFEQAGRYTSACSGTIHRDPWLFGEGRTMAFVAEPFHNLVQQLELSDEGASFAAVRVPARPGEDYAPDFFASEDNWCRPVMVRTGPDGALWIADMYRYMIEHPHWLPEEGREALLPHYRLGDDLGRIFRIAREDEGREGEARRPVPKLAGLDDTALVAQLESPNGWVRDKVHQMLLWRGESPEAMAALHMIALEGSPLARVHALGVLDGFGRLHGPEDAGSAKALAAALRHPHPGLRENALRLAEATENLFIVETVLGLEADPDAKVRLQAAFTLGEWDRPEAGERLAELLREHTGDPLLVAAALSSALPHLGHLAADPEPEVAAVLLPMAVSAEDHATLARLLAPAFDPGVEESDRWALFGRFLAEVSERGEDLARWSARAEGGPLAALLERAGEEILDVAAARMGQDEAPMRQRLAAASLLSEHAPAREAALEFLSGRVRDGVHEEGWGEALAALAATGDDAFAETALASWTQYTPGQREAAIDALMARPAWSARIIEALEAGDLQPGEFDVNRRMRLLRHPDRELRPRASAVFGIDASHARAEVVARYRAAVELEGDPENGLAIYRRACAMCHQHGEEGQAIGPHLASVASHPPEKLLSGILDPNLDIQPGFHAYNVTLKSGEQLYGMMAGETASSLTFKLLDASSRVVRRDEIESLQGTGLSLMPEGLEAAISVEEMADLLAFLREG